MQRSQAISDNKVHGANMGSTWALSVPDGPPIGPMSLAIRDILPTKIVRAIRGVFYLMRLDMPCEGLSDILALDIR